MSLWNYSIVELQFELSCKLDNSNFFCYHIKKRNNKRKVTKNMKYQLINPIN